MEKIVSVTNTGSGDAWVRIGLEKAINLAEGKAGEVDTNLISIQFVDSKWIAGEDGYYYYNAILQPGEVTTNLFTQVEIVGSQVDQTDIGSTLSLTVNAYAVQSENNPAEHPWDAAGWPAD